MSRKKHLIKLSSEERAALQKVSRSNRASMREKTRARILLLADEGCGRERGGSRSDAEVVEQMSCATLTVYNVRRRAVERGAVESIVRGAQQQRKARSSSAKRAS